MFPQTCQSKVFDLSDGVSQYAWFPCREAHEASWGYPSYWLKVSPTVYPSNVAQVTSAKDISSVTWWGNNSSCQTAAQSPRFDATRAGEGTIGDLVSV